MVDFVKALRQGMAAKENADKNQEEIRGILAKASAQFVEAGLQGFAFKVDSAMKLTTESMKKQRIGLLGMALDDMPKYEFSHFVLNAEIGAHQVELCEWVRSDAGYPVKLKYTGREVTCRDGGGLEVALTELLATAYAGREIAKLLNKAGVQLPGLASDGPDQAAP